MQTYDNGRREQNKWKKRKRSSEQGKQIREKWSWEADAVAARGWERGCTDRLAGFSMSEVVLSAFTESLCSPYSGTWGDFGLQAPPPITAARLAAKPRLAKSHAQINSRLLRSLHLD